MMEVGYTCDIAILISQHKNYQNNTMKLITNPSAREHIEEYSANLNYKHYYNRTKTSTSMIDLYSPNRNPPISRQTVGQEYHYLIGGLRFPFLIHISLLLYITLSNRMYSLFIFYFHLIDIHFKWGDLILTSCIDG